jgi:DNA-binding response OmpR family regulator
MHPLRQLDASKVLIVEAAAVEALDLEQSLKVLGCTVLGPVGSTTEALRLLHRERPGLAVLDTILRDGSSLPVAQQLISADVPFALFAARDDSLLTHPMLRDVPLLPKPYTPPELWASIRQFFVADLTNSLERTNGRIAQAWKSIEGQVLVINRLAMVDLDTTLAEQLLQAYEQTLAILQERRDQLLNELERRGIDRPGARATPRRVNIYD